MILQSGGRRKEMAQCNECQTTDEDLYYYWHGDIEEDYDLGSNDCLCENCFSKIPTKEKRNANKCL